MEQAESGNIRGVVEAASGLAVQNESYLPFADTVTGMAREFQINKLVEMLTRIRTDLEARSE